MLRKYFPFIALLAAALLFFWVKKSQRGKAEPIPAQIENQITADEPFNRNISKIIYSKHAQCRMDCRHIDEAEIKEILQEGKVNYNKIETGPKGTSYPLEGITRDRQHVRVVVAPRENELVVVTVIDLEKEWPCTCN